MSSGRLFLCLGQKCLGRFNLTDKFNISRRHLFCISSLRSSGLPSMPHILKQNNIPEADRKKIEEEVKEMTKDWIPLGYYNTDKNEDIFRFNTTMFLVISLFSSSLMLLLWYWPNRGEWDWAHREAFLELERRRRDGLPLIDRDLVPASRVKLPADEELGPDFKIII
ncbi:NADH dehydrogenase [ubiquinone] 1 beta subcomplex subunit 11 mitochondrial [Fasciola gigantica]|uniref:NADH dehydrogenase [ubiquinone] 1 beta subcomplex subunit 11, mitochondrial n=1 Tax=Fasciola gigantica TaxID=46835 RepID=A0A504YGS4_FASGI|nr:NADH dehydrogenase [ubiquinone] 1 beta subcomplex subunit 11 mitochondrial [Fasciola gigantica]